MLPKRIVFIRLRSLGDLVLMTPVLEAVKKQSDTRTAIVVEEPFDQLFLENPNVDRIITCNRKVSFREKVDLARKIRKFEPDTVIDLHGGTSSSLLTAFSGAGQRVGYQSSRNSWIYNTKVPDSCSVWKKQYLHTVEHQLTPLIVLGYEIPPIPHPRVYFNSEDRDWIEQILRSKGINQDFLLIHPAAAFPTKQWPARGFSELISRLMDDNLKVVVTAGPNEHELVEEVAERSGKDPAVIPPLSLGRFSALASLSCLYIGNDTGTTHIAAALRKPMVVIFGSSDSRA